MRFFLPFILSILMFIIFTSCKNDEKDKIFIVNIEDVKSIELNKNWLIEKLPRKLNDEEISIFVEKFNFLLIKEETNYKINDEKIKDGGSITIKIRLVDDTFFNLERVLTEEVAIFHLDNSTADRKGGYLYLEKAGVVTAEQDKVVEFWEYVDGIMK